MQKSRRKVRPVNQGQVFVNALREVLGLEKLYDKTVLTTSPIVIHEWRQSGMRRVPAGRDR